MLAAYLHAAGLAGGDMRHVYQWVTSEEDTPLRILSCHPGAEETARSQVASYLSLTRRTRTGIVATLSSVLKFMQYPSIVATLTQPDSGPGFDFGSFVRSRDTLYLVAADAQTSPVSPLFLVICAELVAVARQAGSIARPARPPRGQLFGSAGLGEVWDALFPPRMVSRLDPPLTMILDEVANIAPVPAAAWATWAAGSGICLHLITQVYAELVQRWGQHGAAVIWQACKTRITYSATAEDELCRMVEDLCGTVRLRRAEWHGQKRRYAHEEVPVLPRTASADSRVAGPW